MDGRHGRQECSLPEGTGAQRSSFIKHASRFRDTEEKALGTRTPSVWEEHHTELSSDWPGSEWTATFGGKFETVGLRAQRQGGEFRIPNSEFRRPNSEGRYPLGSGPTLVGASALISVGNRRQPRSWNSIVCRQLQPHRRREEREDVPSSSQRSACRCRAMSLTVEFGPS